VTNVQNGRVDEVVTMFQMTKKSVVGKVQFVPGVTLRQRSLRQRRQLYRKDRDVRVGTVDVQSGVSGRWTHRQPGGLFRQHADELVQMNCTGYSGEPCRHRITGNSVEKIKAIGYL